MLEVLGVVFVFGLLVLYVVMHGWGVIIVVLVGAFVIVFLVVIFDFDCFMCGLICVFDVLLVVLCVEMVLQLVVSGLLK